MDDLKYNDDGRRAWVNRWRDKYALGVRGRPSGHALKLLEEVVELCFAAGASPENVMDAVGDEIRKAEKKGEVTYVDDRAKMGEECADVAISLDVVLRECGIDLTAEVAKKIPVLETRQWSPDERGVLRRPR